MRVGDCSSSFRSRPSSYKHHPPRTKDLQPPGLTQRKILLEISILQMKPAQQKQHLGEIEVRQWFEDVDDERGISVRKREVAWRYMDLDIGALFIEHVLHVLEGVELRILRAELRGEIAAVGEES